MRLEATVTVAGEEYRGWTEVRLLLPEVRLAFLGARVADRELPYEVVVTAAGPAGRALSVSSLASADLVVETSVHLKNGSLVKAGMEGKRKEPAVGAWKHTSSLGEQLLGLPGISAREVEGLVLEARYSCGKVNSSARRYLPLVERATREGITVSSSTRNPRVGENIVFHVRSSHSVASLSYLVVSGGRVLVSEELAMAPHLVRTFHLEVTPAMAPLATLLVHWPGKAVVQSIVFPVEGGQVQRPTNIATNFGLQESSHPKVLDSCQLL